MSCEEEATEAVSAARALQPFPHPHPPFALPIMLHLGGQPKITDLDPHFVIEEEVPQFYVTVDDVTTVEVVHGQQCLLHQVTHLRLCQGLATFVQLHQRLGGGEARDGKWRGKGE